MAEILLIVASEFTPTTGDAFLKTTLESMGYVVFYGDDSNPENIVGSDAVVISESVGGATLGSKYSTVAIPVVFHEHAFLDDAGFCLTANISTTASQTQVIWTGVTSIVNGPYGTLSGTDTIYSSAATLGWFDVAGKASGVAAIAGTTSNPTTQITCAVADAGAALIGVGAAPHRRAFLSVHDTGAANLTADGLIALKNTYAWALQGSQYSVTSIGAIGV